MPTLKANAHFNSVAICPLHVDVNGTQVSVLDMPLKAEFLKYEKEDGTIAYMTMGEYEVAGGYIFPRSEDGRYIAMFVEFLDTHNETTAFKGILKANGVKLAGLDVTQTADNLCWYLTLSQYINEFVPQNKIFPVADEVEL
jgi:hypothetical protein